MLRKSLSAKCCAVLLFTAVSWLGCSPSDVLDGTPVGTRAAMGPSLNTEEEPPIIELEVDAEVFVSDAFGTPGAPGSTYQYHMTLAFDSTDIRVESEFSPTSLPELDPSETVRVSTSVFDTFGEQLSVGLADGSSASAPVSMDGGSSFEALPGPIPDGRLPSGETGERSVRAFRGELRKSDYSRVLSGIANRVSTPGGIAHFHREELRTFGRGISPAVVSPPRAAAGAPGGVTSAAERGRRRGGWRAPDALACDSCCRGCSRCGSGAEGGR